MIIGSSSTRRILGFCVMSLPEIGRYRCPDRNGPPTSRGSNRPARPRAGPGPARRSRQVVAVDVHALGRLIGQTVQLALERGGVPDHGQPKLVGKDVGLGGAPYV